MTRLERSLALLRELNAARLRYSGWAGAELVNAAVRALVLHDEECIAHGQLSLLAYTPAVVPPRPSGCVECTAYAPLPEATTRNGEHLWLCRRCRDGRLSDDARRQLNAYDYVRRRLAS